MSSKPRKKRSTQGISDKKRLLKISGLRVNFTDTDPLIEIADETTIKALPYGHRNSLLAPNAGYIFVENKEFIFKNELTWVITVTPISICGDNMTDPVEHIARCKCDEITDSVQAYLESTMARIDMDFYSHWLFCCEVRR